ncbi:DUF2169 domain-containing protein [Pendulispora brunnea]|uniref:DUF2169 domain-containing protein n=1 Tax=Pendulispora brunnea TaxID=2905690 RepID=A0ABZ2KBV0_9BACT
MNHTPFAARYLPLDVDDGRVRATVIVKATYEAAPDGSLVPTAEQLPIVADRLDTSFGVFHTDHFVSKEGADLCVLGTIRRVQPVPHVALFLMVGTFRHQLLAFGERRWIRANGSLVPSSPTPFSELPLGYQYAYGGKAEFNHEMAAWPDNPEGRGYYFTAAQAEGNPLPNIESARNPLIRTWEERPTVAGWAPYPMFWGLRAREGIEPRDGGKTLSIPRLRARLYNQAHPELILPKIVQGEHICITGLRAHDLWLEIPRDSVSVDVRVADTSMQAGGVLDGVFVWADLGRLTITYRARFEYTFRRGDRRVISVGLQSGTRAMTQGVTNARIS